MPKNPARKSGSSVSSSGRASTAAFEAGTAAAVTTRHHDAILEEARRAGLLGGEKSEHVSFRAPPALIEAAKRETGIASTSELGTLALALLAQPDPVAAILRRTRGRLGRDHTLEH